MAAPALIAALAGCAGSTPPPEPEVARPAPEVVPAAPAPPPPPPPAVGLALGEHTTCVARADGFVSCTGALELGGELVGRLEVSDREVCARADGRVTCLRAGGRRETPTPFVELVRGPGTPCGRDAAGGVWCLQPGFEDESDAEVTPIALPRPATALGADGARIHALLDDGTLWAWSPVGHGRPLAPARVAKGIRAVDSAPWTRLCALWGFRIRCWAAGTEERAWTVAGVRGLAVGRAHTCVLGDDGVVCWGDGSHGQTDAPAVDWPSTIDAGDDRTCVIDQGEVRCWGQP